MKTQALSFSEDRKHFENEAFRKRWRLDNNGISLPDFPRGLFLEFCVFAIEQIYMLKDRIQPDCLHKNIQVDVDVEREPWERG